LRPVKIVIKLGVVTYKKAMWQKFDIEYLLRGKKTVYEALNGSNLLDIVEGVKNCRQVSFDDKAFIMSIDF